jgi:TusA-related sulfurtransferase
MPRNSAIAADRVLDCSGLVCPLPILQARKAMEDLTVGQVLEIIATDLGSVVDVQAWTRRTGHQLLSYEDEGKRFVFYIRKAK